MIATLLSIDKSVATKSPSIVCTKIATKVFKDGDLVEVNANEGIARLLKSRNRK